MIAWRPSSWLGVSLAAPERQLGPCFQCAPMSPEPHSRWLRRERSLPHWYPHGMCDSDGRQMFVVRRSCVVCAPDWPGRCGARAMLEEVPQERPPLRAAPLVSALPDRRPASRARSPGAAKRAGRILRAQPPASDGLPTGSAGNSVLGRGQNLGDCRCSLSREHLRTQHDTGLSRENLHEPHVRRA